MDRNGGNVQFSCMSRVTKTKLILLVALMLGGSSVVAQWLPSSPLRITRLDFSGTLEWSNRICPALPVYEVLRANSPTGAWQHHLYVTNQQSVPLTNALGSSPGEVFHRLALVGDTPMTFDYNFTDGFFETVSGQLRFGIVNMGSNHWVCSSSDPEFGSSGHPVGSGTLYGGLTRDALGSYIVRLKFTPGSEGYFLEGKLHQSTSNGQCDCDSLSGTVYLSGFAGNTPIGTFTATRVP